MLWLDGRKILGKDIKVSGALPLAAEDMSGNSSATPQAETGDKGKSLDVSMVIRFKDSGWLSDLIALAEGKDGNAERTKFIVQNRTAAAMGIKQVVFQGQLSVRESEKLQAWEVSFTLAEYRSTPEKKEERNPKAAARKVAAQTATGAAAQGAAGATNGGGEAGNTSGGAESLSGFERILQRIDGALK